MALYVVLEDFNGRKTDLEEGQVIDSRLFDLDDLRRAGLAIFPVSDPSVLDAVTAYQNQRRLGKRYTLPWGELLPLVLASRGGASGIGTLTGQSVEERLGVASTGRVFNATPSGSIDGSNAIFTTTSAFLSGSEAVFYNGIRQMEGVGCDYVRSESGGAGTGFDTLTFAEPPRSGDVLTIDFTPA